jgi:uncharacterized protein (DUF1015 family)
VPRVAPFAALRYDERVAGPIDRLTAPPYDVIDEGRRRGYLEASAHSVVHLDLAEGAADPDAPGNRYEGAAELLRSWRREGVLRQDEPAYFAYEMSFARDGEPRRVRGLLCAMELEDWGGRVLPHEHVMPGPVEDRLHLLRATRTHLSAVYGTIAGPHPPLGEALAEAAATSPLSEVTDREDVTHRVWRLDADTPFDRWLEDDHLLIADGHHRYTTALAYRDERRATEGPGPWDRVLTFVVDAAQEHLEVLPYHRIQRRGVVPPDGELAALEDLPGALRDAEGTVGLVVPGDGPRGASGRVLRLPTDGGPTVRALHRAWLDREAPDDAVAFTHELDEALAAVAQGDARAAYLLPPTTPERILEIVERGERMPRKSTFFWPKPRTGMVLMPLDAGS